MSASEKKPLVPSSSHITVKIKSQGDICVFFRVKKDVLLRTIMQAYSDKVGEQMSTIRFLFDGTRINPNQTINELGLEEGDEIDAFVEQGGGPCSLCHRTLRAS